MKRLKHKTEKVEECGISLFAHEQKIKWFLDIGFSKHIIGDKSKFVFLK